MLVLKYDSIFLFSMPIIQTLYIDTSNDVRIRSYFSNTEGVREILPQAVCLFYQQVFNLQFGTHLCGQRRWRKLREIRGRIGAKKVFYRCCRKRWTFCGMLFVNIC
jgi:hypothetical protein